MCCSSLFCRLCLSISDFHPDTWNPAWSVSTILTGLLSFMVCLIIPIKGFWKLHLLVWNIFLLIKFDYSMFVHTVYLVIHCPLTGLKHVLIKVFEQNLSLVSDYM